MVWYCEVHLFTIIVAHLCIKSYSWRPSSYFPSKAFHTYLFQNWGSNSNQGRKSTRMDRSIAKFSPFIWHEKSSCFRLTDWSIPPNLSQKITVHSCNQWTCLWLWAQRLNLYTKNQINMTRIWLIVSWCCMCRSDGGIGIQLLLHIVQELCYMVFPLLVVWVIFFGVCVCVWRFCHTD